MNLHNTWIFLWNVILLSMISAVFFTAGVFAARMPGFTEIRFRVYFIVSIATLFLMLVFLENVDVHISSQLWEKVITLVAFSFFAFPAGAAWEKAERKPKLIYLLLIIGVIIGAFFIDKHM